MSQCNILCDFHIPYDSVSCVVGPSPAGMRHQMSKWLEAAMIPKAWQRMASRKCWVFPYITITKFSWIFLVPTQSLRKKECLYRHIKFFGNGGFVFGHIFWCTLETKWLCLWQPSLIHLSWKWMWGHASCAAKDGSLWTKRSTDLPNYDSGYMIWKLQNIPFSLQSHFQLTVISWSIIYRASKVIICDQVPCLSSSVPTIRGPCMHGLANQPS